MNCVTDHKWTLYHFVAQSGSVPCLEFVSSLNLSKTSKSRAGRTPLHVAAECGHLDAVRWLTEHGCNVDVQDQNGYQPIHLAARKGHIHVVRFLLQEGADPKSMSRRKWTVLHNAAAGGYFDLSQLLIEAGADIEARDESGRTVLAAAAGASDAGVADFLLNAGASPLEDEVMDWTPLHFAASAGHLDLVIRLSKMGARWSTATKQGATALHITAGYGREDVVMWLLSVGADVNVADCDGYTPLAKTIHCGSLALTKELLAHGADATIKLSGNYSLQCYAAECGHLDILKHLVSLGADLDIRSDDGVSLLHVATEKSFEVLEYLLQECHQNPNVTTNDNFTPLHAAVYTCRLPSIRLLLRYGADPHVLDSFGRSSLDWARNWQPMLNCFAQATGQDQKLDETHTARLIRTSISKLIANVQAESINYHLLGHCLIYLNDLENACTAFEQRIVVSPDEDCLTHRASCILCETDYNIQGHCYVCRICPDIDLCEDCMSQYKHGAAFRACRNHDFLDIPSTSWWLRPTGIVNDDGHTRSQWLLSLWRKCSDTEWDDL